MIQVLIAVLLAALVFWLAGMLGLPTIVAVIAAIVTLFVVVPIGGSFR